MPVVVDLEIVRRKRTRQELLRAELSMDVVRDLRADLEAASSSLRGNSRSFLGVLTYLLDGPADRVAN